MKKLHIKTLILFFSICVFSCNSNKKTERENEPTIHSIDEDDTEMNDAIEKAKQTLDSFDYAFKNNSRVFTPKKEDGFHGFVPYPDYLPNTPKAWRDSIKGRCNNVNKIKLLQFCE